MRVQANGRVEGTIGGGEFEKKVIVNAQSCLQTGIPGLFEHHLLHDHQMCCGGTVKVYVEPEMEQAQLYIFGAGHVGQALARMALEAGFSVTLFDDRPDYIAQAGQCQAQTLLGDFIHLAGQVPFGPNCYLAIMTYNHEIDRQLLAHCAPRQWAYLGFIGSKRKVMIAEKMLLSLNQLSPEEIGEIDMPMGLDIGAQGPVEIAISIMARLIMVKNNKTENDER